MKIIQTKVDALYNNKMKRSSPGNNKLIISLEFIFITVYFRFDILMHLAGFLRSTVTVGRTVVADRNGTNL